VVIYIIVSGMHGHKNIPSANPLFSGIIMSSPYSHISTIRVKRSLPTLQRRGSCWSTEVSFNQSKIERQQLSSKYCSLTLLPRFKTSMWIIF